MCKPSCCPGISGSSFMPIAVLIGAGIILAERRPILHAADELLHAVLIIVSVLAGAAIVTTAIIMVIHARRTRRPAALPNFRVAATGRTLRALPGSALARAEITRRAHTAEAGPVVITEMHSVPRLTADRNSHLSRRRGTHRPEREEVGHAGPEILP